jgi:membrane-associated phospholipid phosphatase
MEKKMKKVGFPVLLVAAGIGLSILFIYLFTEVAEDMLEEEVKGFDGAIIDFFKYIESDTLDQVMAFVTELGSVWFLSLLSIITVIMLWVRKRDKWGILFFIIGIGGGGLLTKILKFYYERGRPSINPEYDAVGYSFPSGHSMGSLIFYGFATYFIVRSERSKMVKWIVAAAAGILVIWIGITRIYLGAHFPSDVIAGHLAGAIWLILSILAMEWVAWQHANSVRPIKAVRKFLAQFL